MPHNRNHSISNHVYPTILISDSENIVLKFLYRTKVGRCVLSLLIRPTLSKIIGAFLNMKLSTCFIKPFVKKNDIDMTRFEKVKYHSFNDFFTRKLKDSKKIGNTLVSPCDGKLLIYPITKELTLQIKHSIYSIESLIKDKKTAKFYQRGYAFIFRLTPDDYHRYHFIDNGIIKSHKKIPGVLHTVRPVALKKYPVFTENAREMTVMETENYGFITQIEVGALMVGKISNYKTSGSFQKGEEKGKFLFGGSTIIWLLEKDKVQINPDLLENTKNNMESIVHYQDPLNF